MRRSLESSLRRLQTDYVDILFARDVEVGEPRVLLGECYESLLAMKREGLCRAIGMSALPLQVLRCAISTCELDVIITYCHGTLNDDAILTELLPLAHKRDVAVINASPTSMGLRTEVGPQSGTRRANRSRRWHAPPPSPLPPAATRSRAPA